MKGADRMGGRGDKYRDNPFEGSGIRVPVYAAEYSNATDLTADLRKGKSVTLTTDKRKAGSNSIPVYVDSRKAKINKTDVVINSASAIKII